MVKMRLYKTLRVCAAALFLVFVLSGAELLAESNPAEVVTAFYSADLNGARLVPDKYNARIRPLVTWKHEPGWDTVFVAKAAHISKVEHMARDEAKVEVRYDILGVWSSEEPLSQLEFKEVVDFIVVKTAGGWKIKEPIFYPHVSPEALSDHLESAIEASKQNEGRAKRLTRQKELLLDMK